MDSDVIVVGAGHNGLTTAAYLAKAGLKVRVFERRSFVGGASITEELWPGFHFSTCAHMIHGLPPRIIRDLNLYERGMKMLPREGYIRLRPDGTYHGPSDHESPRNRTHRSRLTAAERADSRRYGEFKRILSDIVTPYRFQAPPPLDEVRSRIARTPAAGVLDRAISTRVRELQNEFLSTDHLKDLHASEGAAVGRNPLGLHFAYGSINRPDTETGEAHPYGYVEGGMGAVSDAIAAAAREAGAAIHLDAGVAGFLVEGNAVIGVRLENGEEVRSRITVSNLDPKHTFLRLMPSEWVDDRLRRRLEGLITYVSCYKLLAVISETPLWKYWDGDPEQPYRGAITLQASRAEIDAAYDELEGGMPVRKPVISFSMPSFADPDLTQPGYHTASVWIYPAPARLRTGTWGDVREEIAEGIIDQITEFAPNFRSSIRNYIFRTPQDIERENGLTDGCIWHVQHAGEHLFWNRPLPELSQYRAPQKGLYLCGAGQHPGGEVSGIPGHNAAQEVIKDLG